MKTITKITIASALAVLAACGSKNSANNTADINATDLNATTDMNAATDFNATDINATGNLDMNATGNAAMNNTANSAGKSY